VACPWIPVLRCLPRVHRIGKRATVMDTGRTRGVVYDLARDCHTTYGLGFFALLLQVDF
jgi:hypothetical protein